MRRDTRGITLVEITIATILLALVLVPVLGLATSNNRKMAASHHHLRAQICAREAVSMLASLPYGELVRLVGSSSAPGVEVPEAFPGTISLSVTDAGAGTVPQSSTPRMVEVAVTVTWSPNGKNSRRGQASFTATRLVSVPELGLVSPLAAGS